MDVNEEREGKPPWPERMPMDPDSEPWNQFMTSGIVHEAA